MPPGQTADAEPDSSWLASPAHARVKKLNKVHGAIANRTGFLGDVFTHPNAGDPATIGLRLAEGSGSRTHQGPAGGPSRI